MNYKTRILPEPIGPGMFRRCMACERWFALRREAVRTDDLVGKVTTYRCTKCDKVTEFAKHLPKGVI